MQQIYEGDKYANTNPTWHEEDAPWKAKHIEAIIRENNLDIESVCEIGCGTGEILINLERAFPKAKFVGYEISPHAFERAKLKETDAVKFRLDDIFTDQSFRSDLIILADVIEHVEDYIAFLKNVKPIAKYKILHVPLDLSVQSVTRSWPIMELRKNVGHLHYFYKETIISTLVDCGYDIIDHKYTASRLELPNQTFSSRLMRMPRRLAYLVNPDIAVRLLGGYSLLILTT